MRFQSPLCWAIAVTTLAFGCESPPGQRAVTAGTRDPSTLRGRLEPMPELPASGGPILVYLEPITAPAGVAQVATRTVALRRRGGELQPGFVLTYSGQILVFSNQDEVHHALFSYSEPNAFELGTLGVGETEAISFSAPGAVRFYCALHESEHGLIFVAPSPYLALADARGEYSLVGVPPGRYRLRTWSDAYPNFDREITLRSGESAWREIDFQVDADTGPE